MEVDRTYQARTAMSTRSSKLLPRDLTSESFILAGSRSWTDRSSRRATSPTRSVTSVKPRSVSSMGGSMRDVIVQEGVSSWETRGSVAEPVPTPVAHEQTRGGGGKPHAQQGAEDGPPPVPKQQEPRAPRRLKAPANIQEKEPLHAIYMLPPRRETSPSRLLHRHSSPVKSVQTPVKSVQKRRSVSALGDAPAPEPAPAPAPAPEAVHALGSPIALRAPPLIATRASVFTPTRLRPPIFNPPPVEPGASFGISVCNSERGRRRTSDACGNTPAWEPARAPEAAGALHSKLVEEEPGEFVLSLSRAGWCETGGSEV
jgi:hypothetical protein